MSAKRQRIPSMSEHFPDQVVTVSDLINSRKLFSSEIVDKEVNHFYNELGVPEAYFQAASPHDVANHIITLLASKSLARTSGRTLNFEIREEGKNSAMFAVRSKIMSESKSVSREVGGPSPALRLERYLEKKYLSAGSKDVVDAAQDTGTSGLQEHFLKKDVPGSSLSFSSSEVEGEPVVWRMGCYRTTGVLDEDMPYHLRMYFLKAPDFANENPKAGETDIHQLACKSFLAVAPEGLKEKYQRIVAQAASQLAPVIEYDIPGNVAEDGSTTTTCPRIIVAFRGGSTHSYFSGISDVYRYYNMYATRKYVEPFSNGVVLFSFYLHPLKGKQLAAMDEVVRDASLHYVLPRTSLTPLLSSGMLSPREVAYGYAAWKFAFHFLNRCLDEYRDISNLLRGTADEKALQKLSKLHKSLQTHAFTEGMLLDAMFRSVDVIKYLYSDFNDRHNPRACLGETKSAEACTPSGRPMMLAEGVEEAMTFLKRNCKTETDLQVFSAVLTFNRHVLKTNFYRREKTALSFRMHPGFLPVSKYPDTPFGFFMVIGAEFRGFHIRFRDVARGGIRLIKSPYAQAFAQNVTTVFDECYNLANTQQRKNKDIPEGGSKGTVLLNLAYQDRPRIAFEKYIDSIMDIILPNKEIVDHYGKEEILFFGPDENTADYMDWAANHAKARGYRFWKACTTGKTVKMGGIPHDVYGMTTHSVRAYVLGIQRVLGLDPSKCTKVQTGGPDGDLGSNEIKMANEVTTAIVDGSGVLYDPNGIDHAELKRLAGLRKPVEHFDKSKLSPTGALVLVGDRDVVLPDGTKIESGLHFRNTFHLFPKASADFFVPCGGRPAAVQEDNVEEFLFDEERRLRFKYIVEGANLFFTQDARLAIEKHGLVVIKDASANKGGVTASSMEVLAAITLRDEEFSKHMAVFDEKNVPKFYQEYVKEAQEIIRRNAELEFECLWKENVRTKKPISVLTDLLSNKITELSAKIEESETLWNNTQLRSLVLTQAVPKALVHLLGSAEEVLSRLPVNYKRALFGSRLASRFVYEMGLSTPEFAFYEFVDNLTKSVAVNGDASME